jgi:hypothetical protein
MAPRQVACGKSGELGNGFVGLFANLRAIELLLEMTAAASRRCFEGVGGSNDAFDNFLEKVLKGVSRLRSERQEMK